MSKILEAVLLAFFWSPADTQNGRLEDLRHLHFCSTHATTLSPTRATHRAAANSIARQDLRGWRRRNFAPLAGQLDPFLKQNLSATSALPLPQGRQVVCATNKSLTDNEETANYGNVPQVRRAHRARNATAHKVSKVQPGVPHVGLREAFRLDRQPHSKTGGLPKGERMTR